MQTSPLSTTPALPNDLKNELYKQAKVAFVGAGPSALITALQTRILNPDPDFTILMFEKRYIHIRHHILKIDQASFKDFPLHPVFTRLFQKWNPKKTKAFIFPHPPLSKILKRKL